MRKKIIMIFVLIAFILSACSTAQTNTPDTQNTPGNGELPEVTKLVLGTLQLKDTENAVTPEQAKELLPLWQVYLSLADSDTAAQEEIDALVEQIGEMMTPEQTQAIYALQLSQEDMFKLMQESGIGMSNRPQVSESSQGGTSGGFGPPDGGGAPPDGGMPGGGMPSGAQSLSEGQIATAQAARGAGGFGGVPTTLIEAVIAYLQETADS